MSKVIFDAASAYLELHENGTVSVLEDDSTGCYPALIGVEEVKALFEAMKKCPALTGDKEAEPAPELTAPEGYVATPVTSVSCEGCEFEDAILRLRCVCPRALVPPYRYKRLVCELLAEEQGVLAVVLKKKGKGN